MQLMINSIKGGEIYYCVEGEFEVELKRSSNCLDLTIVYYTFYISFTNPRVQKEIS